MIEARDCITGESYEWDATQAPNRNRTVLLGEKWKPFPGFHGYLLRPDHEQCLLVMKAGTLHLMNQYPNKHKGWLVFMWRDGIRHKVELYDYYKKFGSPAAIKQLEIEL